MARKRLPKPTIEPQGIATAGRADSIAENREKVMAHIRKAEMEIETLNRLLDNWTGSRASHFFKRTIAEKQKWEGAHADWLRVLEGLGATEQSKNQSAAPSPAVELTEREKKIFEVIRRGAEGLQYCRELDNAHIGSRRKGSWKGAPSTYESAYRMGEPWRHRIQDEKSKISRKAKLAQARPPLASE